MIYPIHIMVVVKPIFCNIFFHLKSPLASMQGRIGESFNDVLTRMLNRVKLDEVVSDQVKDGEKQAK